MAESLSSLLARAQDLAWQGRGRDADEVLAAVDPATLDEADLMAWALPRAANQFWMLDEPERATAFLRALRGRVSSDATVDALLGTFAMNAGDLQRARELSDSVLTSAEATDQAVGWAASAAALAHARMGEFGPVDSLASRAVSAGHPGLLRYTSGYGQVLAAVFGGDLEQAEAVARELTVDDGPGHSIGHLLIAEVLTFRGDLDDAVGLLRSAADSLAPTGYSWTPLAWMLLAQTLGQQGSTVAAAKALGRAESRHGLKSMLFAPELALARAWTCWARKDSIGAVGAARESFRAAERGGQSAVALRAVHDGVRLGDVRAAACLDGLPVQGVFARVTASHAHALAAHDALGLAAVADEWSDLGFGAAAADAARQVEELLPDGGEAHQ
ncbi:MAG: hypothetical protein HYZ39_18030 [Mycolicibacterium cosmeticum]|nr:hypothetical protein [Mycolicibacterium cosmeticum]